MSARWKQMAMTLVNSWYSRSLSVEANTGNRVMLAELIVMSSRLIQCVKSLVLLT